MKKEARGGLFLIAFVDFWLMALALWSAIALRYFSIPTWELLGAHLLPFGFLFILSILVFYIAGLYEPNTVILRRKVPMILLNAMLANTLIGFAIFYFFPFVGITPKTTMLLYVGILFAFLWGWRTYGGSILGVRQKEPAIFIGGGEEMGRLIKAVEESPLYGISFLKIINLDQNSASSLDQEIDGILHRTHIQTIIVDLAHPAIAPYLKKLQRYQFQGVNFLDQSQVYEDVFDRVPLSLIGYAWLLEHVRFRAHFGYDLLKRLMDVVLSSVLLLFSLPLYPFVILAIKLEDGGPAFLFQKRTGEHDQLISIIKFRTMKGSDRGKWVIENDPRITKVGAFLRTSRIDELPQLWNVLLGHLSLIGPRPELPDLVKYYMSVIPYYNVRHLVKPGLSGWAQVHHEKPPHSVEETKEKLSYDLYYIKNRNFMLDLKIALKTVKTLLSRAGV